MLHHPHDVLDEGEVSGEFPFREAADVPHQPFPAVNPSMEQIQLGRCGKAALTEVWKSAKQAWDETTMYGRFNPSQLIFLTRELLNMNGK